MADGRSPFPSQFEYCLNRYAALMRLVHPQSLPYEYTTLRHADSIRLLHLHPATSPWSPLEVSLHEVRLDDHPDFVALSYTWQTDDIRRAPTRLRCDGAIMGVTKNCHMALWRLRDSGVRVLWVDAVCINQSNIGERSAQVSLMRRIYSQATSVTIWLGEASMAVDPATSRPLSDLGMELVHDFAHEVLNRSYAGLENQGGDIYCQEFVKSQKAFFDSNIGKDPDKIIDGLTPRIQGLWDIFHRSWWSRLWTLQELALAKSATFVCGGKSESFDNFFVVIRTLSHKEQPVKDVEFLSLLIGIALLQAHMRHCAHNVDWNARFSTPGAKALDVLHRTATLRAQDPRDKIYGILGLFGDRGSDPQNVFPAPDYEKTATELYTDVSRAIITSTRKLDIMTSGHGFFQSTLPNLPFWVVAWNSSPAHYVSVSNFDAARGSHIVYEDSDDSRLLRLKGRTVDSVQDVGERTGRMANIDKAECVRLWRQWCDFAFSLPSYPTGEKVVDAYRFTLCWGESMANIRLGPDEYREKFEAWLKILGTHDAVNSVSSCIFKDQTTMEFSDRAHVATIFERLLGKTKKSYLAMLPRGTGIGDKIVVLNGGTVPFVLRPEGDNFKFVGPCYVHGIMDGEAVAEDPATDALEWFSLC